MATETRVGCSGVITIMAISAIGDGGVGTGQGVIIAMNRESGRSPARIGRMAIFTCRRYAYCGMVRIGCLVVIRLVAAKAAVRGVCVIPLVA